jgi:hypothetical protein
MTTSILAAHAVPTDLWLIDTQAIASHVVR